MHNSSNDVSIVLFDGECNLCNSSVNFILKHDHKNKFQFASLQSPKAFELLGSKEHSTLTTVLLVEKGKVFTKSTAVLRICRHLNGLLPLFFVFILIPPILRNAIYDYIATNRYKWFGKRDRCMIPTKEQKAKFIN